jgi:hypothetical protein
MTVVLPLELLLQIATLLHVEKVSLAPFTSVCRSWQSAFEPFIYSKLIIYSDDEHKDEGQTGISLKKFQQLTSGNRAIRRTWIRELEYKILVPYNLPDWTTRKGNLWRNPENYTTDNPVRKANDVAFQAGVVDLFRELNSWDRNSRLSLILGILGCSQGEEPAPEPWTQYYQDAGEFRWDYRHGSRLSVPPYRARFVQDMPYLAHVPCIEKLTFQNWPRPHHIWTGAIKTIVQHCSNVIELHLNLDEYIRPDHLIYLQKRRAGISCLPFTLIVY